MKQGPMTWHVLLKALADGGALRPGRSSSLTDKNADGPARTLAQQGTFMWEQWNPGLRRGGRATRSTTSRCRTAGARGASSTRIESLLGVSGHLARRRRRSRSRRRPSTRPTCSRVSGSAWTQRGTVSTAWKKVSGTYVLDVTVPANVKATVAIPNPGGAVKLRRRRRGRAALKPVTPDGRTLFTVGSGATHFSIGSTRRRARAAAPCPRRCSLTLGAPASFGAFTPGVDTHL